jgi:EmrB/QacA subfamily drug resistance transporter
MDTTCGIKQAHLDTARRGAIAGLSLSMLMPSLDTSSANAVLPVLADQWGQNFATVQWIMLAYLLTLTSLIVAAGRTGDIVGRRRLLLTGIVVFTLASLVCGSAPSLPLLIAARAVQGVGAAIMLALTMSMAGAVAPGARTGSVLGLLGTMSALGTTLGPSLGGALTGAWGWRMVFLMNVPVGILNFYLTYRFLPDDEPSAGRRHTAIDLLGTLVLALTLIAYAMGMTSLNRGTYAGVSGLLLALAAIGIIAFVHVERRTAHPLIHLSLFRIPGLSRGLAMSTLVAGVLMTSLVVGPFYLSRGLGLDAFHAGMFLSVGPLFAALTGVPAGRLVDRFGTKRLTLVGLMIMMCGAGALAVMTREAGIVAFLVSTAVLTAGYALFQTANNASVMEMGGKQKRGLVAGLLSLSRNLGLITGVAVMGTVFVQAVHAADLATATPAGVACGLRVSYAVATGMIAAAVLLARGHKG